MDCKIVQKAAFTVMGKSKMFSYDDSYEKIPLFWNEHFNSEDKNDICGMFGICDGRGNDEKNFEYYIADNYIPWKEVPAKYKTLTIPEGTWAVFPCTMKTLQEINTKVFSEWLPGSNEYTVGGQYSVEMYTPEEYCEIWIPVMRKA